MEERDSYKSVHLVSPSQCVVWCDVHLVSPSQCMVWCVLTQ